MYIATFHTHFGATSFTRILSKLGHSGNMMPVPRVLSASCGVCVKFDSTDGVNYDICTDLDSVYIQEESGKYRLIYSAE